MSKHSDSELRLDNKLLTMSLTSSNNTVGVPMSPGYTMLFPEIVIHAQLGSDFCGRTSQTTLLKDISFRRLNGMFSRLTKNKVSEPATHFFLGPSVPVPKPCHRRPSLFLYN